MVFFPVNFENNYVLKKKKKKGLPQSYFIKANIQKPQHTLEQTLKAPGSDYPVSFFLPAPLLTMHLDVYVGQ